VPQERLRRGGIGAHAPRLAGLDPLFRHQILRNLRHLRAESPRPFHCRTHPPQSLRLNTLTAFVRKWTGEFRPALQVWMTQQRYRSLLDAVSSVIWTGRHAEGWTAQANFLSSPGGVQYVNAVFAELERFFERR